MCVKSCEGIVVHRSNQLTVVLFGPDSHLPAAKLSPDFPVSLRRVGRRSAAVHPCDDVADLGNVTGLEVAIADPY